MEIEKYQKTKDRLAQQNDKTLKIRDQLNIKYFKYQYKICNQEINKLYIVIIKYWIETSTKI